MLKHYFTEKENKYFNYLQEHISNVQKGFDILIEKCPIIFIGLSNDFMKNLKIQIINHDLSKYREEEFNAYCDYFYGEEKTDCIINEFDLAWLKHQHNNPHHHQYWILKQDDGQFKTLKIPLNYIIEMVCDWWAFSIKKGDLQEIQNWYLNNKDKMILENETRQTVETILKFIKNIEV